jgi:hypothetical protein
VFRHADLTGIHKTPQSGVALRLPPQSKIPTATRLQTSARRWPTQSGYAGDDAKIKTTLKEFEILVAILALRGLAGRSAISATKIKFNEWVMQRPSALMTGRRWWPIRHGCPSCSDRQAGADGFDLSRWGNGERNAAKPKARYPSPAGAGEGGRRPGEGRWGKTNSWAERAGASESIPLGFADGARACGNFSKAKCGILVTT